MRWLASAGWIIAAAAGAAEHPPAPPSPPIVYGTVDFPERATQFSTVEFDVTLGGMAAEIAAYPDCAINDAYDADRDGRFVRGTIHIQNSLDHEYLRVPMFAMRERPDGPWLWRARWLPTRVGTWLVSAHVATGRGEDTEKAAHNLEILPASGPGPLVAPGPKDDPHYLRELMPGGQSRACWVFGACRAWVVADDPAAGGWHACEGIDRERDLFPALRESGYDLLNQWMAPWEYLLVHCDRAEFWRDDDGRWQRHELPEAGWKAWACFDQGRAAAFDRLVHACEGGPGRSPIRLLLSPLPHQALQMASHAWGREESGWSVEDAHGTRPPSQLNGFSTFLAPQVMTAWDFFSADRNAEYTSAPRRLFCAQANYLRYVSARWGASPALGAWVLIDELDGVGDEHGLMAKKTGWWAHPDCERWLGQMVQLLRNQVKEEMSHDVIDPCHHPIHAATTSFITGFTPGANLEWEGGPPGERVDCIGWHWYPEWRDDASWREIWGLTIDGIAAFSNRPAPVPRLISEFGAPDRARPEDAPSPLYPTLYHHAIWAAIFSGQAGTPMDWDDGKEFGELQPRPVPGPFDREHYPVDNAAQLRALRRFLGEAQPDHLRRCGSSRAPSIAGSGGTRVFALATDDEHATLRGWLFRPRGEAVITVSGLPAVPYRLRWFDPWTGEELPLAGTLGNGAGGALTFDAQPALAALRAAAPEFPKLAREDRGGDVAFVIEPAP
jgi:hypothetical protein